MQIGDMVNTPRFLKVRITEIFSTREIAYAAGYQEPTHYDNPDYEIAGKHAGENRMTFAAIQK